MQKWKEDPKLYDCGRDEENKKKLDYYDTYIKEFLSADPLKDWNSFDRCKELWNFLLEKKEFRKKSLNVLDCGTKDGQLVEWLNDNNHDCVGIEIDPQYVKYAQKKNRNVISGDICNIDFKSNSFDVVFAHHVHGLCPDYKKGIQEMLRVAKQNATVIFCNQIPGNPKKHYSLVESVSQLDEIVNSCQYKHDRIYFDYWKNGDEHVSILRRK